MAKSETKTSLKVARYDFKAPVFQKTDPALSFLKVQSQFKTAGITVDETKFYAVVVQFNILFEMNNGFNKKTTHLRCIPYIDKKNTSKL